MLNDSLALQLAGRAGTQMLRLVESRLSREEVIGFSRWVCIRSRIAEDVVERALARGVRQYVILGAGLDSFAYRRTDLAEQLRVFEVDHPATQQWKRRRLQKLSIPLPETLVFAPVDFETQSLIEGIEESGFDASLPAVFSWIGVTMYLTIDAIRATLHAIASCAHGSQIVLTYNQPEQLLDNFSRRVTGALAAAMGELGEPFISLFTPDQIQAILSSEGFCDFEDYGPDEARRDYFENRGDVPIAGAQRVLIGAVPPR